MVDLQQLYKSYNNKAVLVNLNLSVKGGQIFGVTGKNGSGKTTLLKIICGFEIADAGKVKILFDIPGKYSIGVSLYESDQLINELDGFTFLGFIGRIYKMSSYEIDKRILELSEYFEFSNVLYKPIDSYSTGTKKKISICTSIFHNPRLLLLDEPFENLDIKSCQKLIALLKTYICPDKVIIITSNQIDHLLELTSNIGILSNGRLTDFQVDPELQTIDVKNKILSELNK